LSPRIIIECSLEIKAHDTGFYEKYGSHQKYEESFDPEINLP
jgi:hypothetical protein